MWLLSLSALAGPADCDVTYRPPSNPLQRADYAGFLTDDYVVDDYPGHIVVPDARGTFPTALIGHGRGYLHTDYEELQQALARVGIASVSFEYVENDFDYNELHFRDVLQTHITALFGADPIVALAKSLDERVALVGHSIAGGYVVGSAPAIEDNSLVDLYSVISLAPNAEELFSFGRDGTLQGLLVIVGSDDADDAVNHPSNSGFLTYDLSGGSYNEVSFNGPTSSRFTKSLVYVHGAEHNSYADSGAGLGGGAYRGTVHAYTVSYLLWSLRDEQDQHIFFKQGAPIDGTEVSLEWTEPTFRRVLDNFQDGTSNLNALGGSNTFVGLTATQDDSQDLDSDSPHDTGALRLAWMTASARATFTLPVPLTGTTDPRDLTRRRYLSLRAGQLEDVGDVDFSVVLRSNVGGVIAEQSHPISAFGQIPEPFALDGAADTVYAMNTVLVPLCAYDQIDRSRVVAVELRFDRPEYNDGVIQLDSLEFID